MYPLKKKIKMMHINECIALKCKIYFKLIKKIMEKNILNSFDNLIIFIDVYS